MMIIAIIVTACLLATCFVPYDRSKANFLPLLGGLLAGGAATGAVVSAGASLIGGALNRRAQKKANEANSPVGQVRQWEAAGINPAFGISQGQYIPQRAVSMGDAFAQAGGLFGEAMQYKHEEALQKTRLKAENKQIRKQLDGLSKRSTPSAYTRYAPTLPLPKQRGVGNVRVADKSDPSKNGLNAVTTKVMQPKFDGESDRLDVDAGGSPREASIHEMDVPFIGRWHTSRPMFGERTEGYAGDLLQVPLIVPQLGEDLFHNARGDYFDANQKRWRKRPRGYAVEPSGSNLATVLPKPDENDSFWEIHRKNKAILQQRINRKSQQWFGKTIYGNN